MTRKDLICWNDGTVLKMATVILAERRWDALPMLADACQEAGCAENSGVVQHLLGRKEWLDMWWEDSENFGRGHWVDAAIPHRLARVVLDWILTGKVNLGLAGPLPESEEPQKLSVLNRATVGWRERGAAS